DLEPNTIAANAGGGIGVSQSPGTIIDNNRIGVSASGALGFGNLGNGVTVVDSTGVTITRNSIAGNAGLGIDLGDDGLTPNDPLDADAGANNLQNYPEITSATRSPDLMVSGTLESEPNTEYRIEGYFTADPGNNEGQIFFSEVVVVTDGSGFATFTLELPPSTPDTFVGGVFSVTATNLVTGDTS